MKLTATAVRNAKPGAKPVKIFDGGGLFLLVNPNGSRWWRFKYRFESKEKLLSLGVYPDVSLADARAKRDDVRKQLGAGIDPGAARKARKANRLDRAANSFEVVAREWLAKFSTNWAPTYTVKVKARFEKDVFPWIGDRPVAEITSRELLEVLRRIEKRGALETAHRALTECGQVFRYAVATGRAKRDPTFDLRGALKAPPPVKHRASIAADGLPTFMTRLARYNGDERTRLGIDFILRTMVRTTEARFAKWPEFEDLEGRSPLWRIPPGRMKIQREHLVPLAPQVVGLLDQLRPLSGRSDLVFVAPTNAGVLSENTFLFALYNLGYHGKATVHGFRGTASTILNENEFEPDWIERQLAHVEKDKVRAAYNAAQWLKQRRQMLLWWSDYLDEAEAKGKMQRDVDELVG